MKIRAYLYLYFCFVTLFFCVFTPLVFGVDVIIIDPGHGGKDPGAISNNEKLKEKNVNLNISKIVAKLIRSKLPNIKIVQTRAGDKYITLGERAETANQYVKRDSIFISIHTNSHNSPKKVEGVEVFYHYSSNNTIGNFRYKEMSKLGLGEFSSHLRRGIFQVVNAENKGRSKKIAEKIADGLKLASKEPIRKVAQSNLYVVSYSIIPAVLVEVGFINSKKLLSDKYQEKIAKGIFLGILKYIKEIEK